MVESELDRATRHSLRTLPEGLAEIVGRHLAAAARVLADDPMLALAHARAAARRAGRVAVVREAVGLCAYRAGEYATALTELRAAARISGSAEYLPVIADCERGLGRPERALALASSPEAGLLDTAAKVEMLIVAAGARRDMGQLDAAVLTLQVPALRSRTGGPWLPRLRYAYADALLEVGRREEARDWFRLAAQADPEQETDALERIDEIDGVHFSELDEEVIGAADEVQGGDAVADEAHPDPSASAVQADAGQQVPGGDAVADEAHPDPSASAVQAGSDAPGGSGGSPPGEATSAPVTDRAGPAVGPPTAGGQEDQGAGNG